jgi:tRNA (mo5U34)-methyltransferase
MAMTRPAAGAATIESLGPWFQNLHLPGGIQTCPDHPFGDFPAFKWQALAPHLPARLDGVRVLEIGCNAGFYAFELARRGAEVVGLDANPHYLHQARWAAGELGLADRIEFRLGQIYEIGGWRERFELILFMGVFYHLRYPLLALDLVASLTPKLLVFQTLTTADEEILPEAAADIDFQHRARLDAPGFPHLSFVETTFCRDPTTWWVPSHAAVLALLRAAGLRLIGHPAHEIYLAEFDPSATLCPADQGEQDSVMQVLSRQRQGRG